MQTSRDAQASEASIERIMQSAGQIGRALRKSDWGPDVGPLWIMAALAGGPQRVTAIAQAMDLDASTVSRHVDALAAKGYVEREADPSDRRARPAVLTEAGRQALCAAKARRRRVVTDQLSKWDAADIATLETLITRLAQDITQELPEGNRA